MPRRALLCLLAAALIGGCFSAAVPIDPGGMPGGMDPEINWGISVRPAPDAPRFRVGVPLPQWDGTGNATPQWPEDLPQVLRLKEGNATFRVEESERERLLVVEGVGPTYLQAVIRSHPDADGATYLRWRWSTANATGPHQESHLVAAWIEGDIEGIGWAIRGWDGACSRIAEASASAPISGPPLSGWVAVRVGASAPACAARGT